MAAKLRIVAFLLGSFALLGIAGAVWSVPGTLRLAAGERAEGTIVAFERVGRSSHPVVRYTGRDGHPVQFRSKVSRGGNERVGDLVPVTYDLQDASLVDMDSFGTVWGRVVIPGVIGLVFAAMAVGVLFLRKVVAA